MVCTHLGNLRKTIPAANGCGDCLKTEDSWVHLPVCASSMAKSTASHDERNLR